MSPLSPPQPPLSDVSGQQPPAELPGAPPNRAGPAARYEGLLPPRGGGGGCTAGGGGGMCMCVWVVCVWGVSCVMCMCTAGGDTGGVCMGGGSGVGGVRLGEGGGVWVGVSGGVGMCVQD